MAKKGNYIDVDELKEQGLLGRVEAVPLVPDADGNLRHQGLEEGYSWVNYGHQPVTPEYAEANRGSWGNADNAWLNDADWNNIQKYKADYEKAKLAGDQAGMDAAHAAAENIRKGYGYSGGVDGSGYNPTMAYTGDLREDEDERESSRGDRGNSYLDGIKGGFSYETAPQYVNRYQQQIDALTQAILGRQPFSYDPETDPTYQQYKADYTRMGQQAMQDTLAQVAARTGGIASSYGVGASQQAFNNYMAQLAGKVPELRQLAYSMYMDDLNSQRNDLNMLMGLEQGDYGKYLDQLGQWNTDRNFDYGQYRDDIADSQWQTQFDYGVSRDQMVDSQWQQQFAYQQEQDKLAQQNWQTQWDYQLEQDALARQDALKKLYASSVGNNSTASTLQVIYDMDNEAEVYDYLVSNGYSNAEVQSYMNYWAQNRQLAASPEAPSGNYSAIVELMQEMQGEDAKISEVRQMLEEAYRDGMITETEYRKLLNQSR